jgi:hypothetical protein
VAEKGFAQFGMERRIEGSIEMRSTIVAAVLALAGAGFALSSPADAAVFAPDQGVIRDHAGSAIIQVQGGQGQQRGRNRPAPRAVPNRGGPRTGNFRAGQQRGGQHRAIVRPGGPGRGVAARRGPGRAAGIHHRGYRPAGYRRWHPRHLVYHRWRHRPYYGRIIGGIAIGTILAASAYYAYAAEPPAPGLCWFWADEDEVQGYWDYCVDPH